MAFLIPVAEGIVTGVGALTASEVVAGGVAVGGGVVGGIKLAKELASEGADLTREAKRFKDEVSGFIGPMNSTQTGQNTGVHKENGAPVLSTTTYKKLQGSSKKKRKQAAKLTNKIQKISNTSEECEDVNKRLRALEKANAVIFSQHTHKVWTDFEMSALYGRTTSECLTLMGYSDLIDAAERLQYWNPITGVLDGNDALGDQAHKTRISIKSVNLRVTVLNQTNKSCTGHAYFATAKQENSSGPENVYGDVLQEAGLSLGEVSSQLYDPTEFKTYNKYFKHHGKKKFTLKPGQKKVFFFNIKGWEWDPTIAGIGDKTLSDHRQDRVTYFCCRMNGEMTADRGVSANASTQPVSLTVLAEKTIKIRYDGAGPAVDLHTFVDLRTANGLNLHSYGPKMQAELYTETIGNFLNN